MEALLRMRAMGSRLQEFLGDAHPFLDRQLHRRAQDPQPSIGVGTVQEVVRASFKHLQANMQTRNARVSPTIGWGPAFGEQQPFGDRRLPRELPLIFWT